mmetsp:Transcript_21964/g.68145  ORF Transcript_21964/g.68145 Transcript_21964/m.68145 type:complete len:554 (-) Transcript_21964:931-2592(-)
MGLMRNDNRGTKATRRQCVRAWRASATPSAPTVPPWDQQRERRKRPQFSGSRGSSVAPAATAATAETATATAPRVAAATATALAARGCVRVLVVGREARDAVAALAGEEVEAGLRAALDDHVAVVVVPVAGEGVVEQQARHDGLHLVGREAEAGHEVVDGERRVVLAAGDEEDLEAVLAQLRLEQGEGVAALREHLPRRDAADVADGLGHRTVLQRLVRGVDELRVLVRRAAEHGVLVAFAQAEELLGALRALVGVLGLDDDVVGHGQHEVAVLQQLHRHGVVRRHHAHAVAGGLLHVLVAEAALRAEEVGLPEQLTQLARVLRAEVAQQLQAVAEEADAERAEAELGDGAVVAHEQRVLGLHRVELDVGGEERVARLVEAVVQGNAVDVRQLRRDLGVGVGHVAVDHRGELRDGVARRLLQHERLRREAAQQLVCLRRPHAQDVEQRGGAAADTALLADGDVVREGTVEGAGGEGLVLNARGVGGVRAVLHRLHESVVQADGDRAPAVLDRRERVAELRATLANAQLALLGLRDGKHERALRVAPHGGRRAG